MKNTVFAFAAFAASILPAASSAELAAPLNVKAADPMALATFISSDCSGQRMPLSFNYGGIRIDSIPSGWKTRLTHSDATDGRENLVRTISDPASGLEIECAYTTYPDFPVAEWVVKLRNNSKDSTALISDILPLDIQLPSAIPTIHYNTGGHSGIGEYEPKSKTLWSHEAPFGFSTRYGGFPTADYLPFFNTSWRDKGGEHGVITAIGWPARWRAEFKNHGDSVLSMKMGQLRTSLRLAPGEEIRTPLTVLMFWRGNREDAQNMWRSWMWNWNVPRPDGKLPSPMLEGASSSWFAEMFHAKDTDQMEFIDCYADNGVKLNYWWMDAGWYPNKGGTWQDLLGSWWPDPKRYPEGLAKISRHAKERGHKTLLWFEPERVTRGSWLWENRPEWLLRVDNPAYPGFFNYGIKEAREWMVNHVDSVLNAEQIGLYRQDFAVMSGDYWDAADRSQPDRTGMAENMCVTGYLDYIDRLMERHPGMLMDICAAGGKRLELENLRRAVPLWRSDYAYEPTGVQGQTMGLSEWIPYSGTGVMALTPYDIRSNMSPSMVLNFDARRNDVDWKTLRKVIGQWREVADAYRGDFYKLTSHSTDNANWAGWMFFNPDSRIGFIQMFRRPESSYTSGIWRLKGLAPVTVYDITDMDTGKTIATRSGKDLMETGLELEIPERRTDRMLRISAR